VKSVKWVKWVEGVKSVKWVNWDCMQESVAASERRYAGHLDLAGDVEMRAGTPESSGREEMAIVFDNCL
jgi:hypothetical protein